MMEPLPGLSRVHFGTDTTAARAAGGDESIESLVWPLRMRPVALFAGSMSQATYWYAEMGLRCGFVGVVPSVVDRRGLLHDVSEAFFVGTWERIDTTTLALGHSFLTMPSPRPTPITHVCSPAGEVIEPKLRWIRWESPSSGKGTAWHLVDMGHGIAGVKGRYVGDTETVGVSCGLSFSRQRIVGGPGQFYETIVRYGVPTGACRACEMYARSRHPSESFGDQGEKLREVAEVARATIAIASAGRSAVYTRRAFEKVRGELGL